MIGFNIISLMESIKFIVSILILVRLINIIDLIIESFLWFDDL